MTLPTFSEFFAALWGRAPFPWQARLAAEVLERGWPEVLDLPTGAGKTSTLDIAMYCLAARPECIARRTVLVVDRRIVVDQGAERVRTILSRMRQNPTGPLRAVADALRALWSGPDAADPFAVAVMRGGMPRDNDWARRPDQPVFGVSTVDQVGSRLLFRGYGVSPRSASIHAGLLGNDTLVLLDEVHLAVPFAQTLHDLRTRFMPKVAGLPQRFHVVQMSATVGPLGPNVRVFGLALEDRAHALLKKRLSASKIARLVPVRVTGDDEAKKQGVLADAIVAEVLRLQTDAVPVVGVVVNRVETARRIREILRSDCGKSESEVVLVTGRMRPIDRDALVHRVLLPRVGPRGERADADTSLIVVATQCIEAGADLDFDALVTECASLDALRQRFGRLDREGARGRTFAAVLARTDSIAKDAKDPVYGMALSRTWKWLNERAKDGLVDFGIDALLLPEDAALSEDLIAPRLDAPVMLPAHVDAWSQTSPVPDFDPDVALWLHGNQEAPADVQVVWRADVKAADILVADDTQLDSVTRKLSARRPSSLEAMSLPISAVRRWLGGKAPASMADVAFTSDEEDDWRGRRDKAAGDFVAIVWDGDNTRRTTVADIRPGQVLVLPHTLGGVLSGNFEPNSRECVVDLGDIAQLRARGIASLLVDPNALSFWHVEGRFAALPAVDNDESVRDTRDRIETWLHSWGTRPVDCLCSEREWAALHAALAASRKPTILQEAGVLYIWSKVSRSDMGFDKSALSAEVADAFTEDDDSSFRRREVSLARHSGDVELYARQFGQALGFGERFVRALELAGLLHDVGKADPRFQRWLVGGSEVRAGALSEPLAKSALAAGSVQERRVARRRAGYPEGYRHELLSLAMLERLDEQLAPDAEMRDLVLHLVASHHGWCRPFAPMVDDSEDVPVSFGLGKYVLAAGTRHGLARLDSGVADRYWRLVRRYGWWGVAWLEAVLRLADHRASEEAAGERP